MMERQLHQMVRLVDDLLDVSRITTGKLSLRKEPTDLADGRAWRGRHRVPYHRGAPARLNVSMPDASR